MVTEVIDAGPNQTIADALALLENHRLRAVPIVDAGGKLLGLFTFDVLLSSLLPGPVAVGAHAWLDANLRLDYLVDAEPDVAEHLRALLPLKLNDVMDCQVRVAHRETPLWEGIRLLVQHGSPIPVVEKGNRKLLGLLTVQSATRRLVQLMAEVK